MKKMMLMVFLSSGLVWAQQQSGQGQLPAIPVSLNCDSGRVFTQVSFLLSKCNTGEAAGEVNLGIEAGQFNGKVFCDFTQQRTMALYNEQAGLRINISSRNISYKDYNIRVEFEGEKVAEFDQKFNCESTNL